MKAKGERDAHKISKQKRQSHVGFCVLKEQLKNIRVKVTISHIAAETSDLLREEDTTGEEDTREWQGKS